MYAANIFISKAIRTTREMITKRINGQQKQPGSFILQAEPLSRSYHVAESICRIYNITINRHVINGFCYIFCFMGIIHVVLLVVKALSSRGQEIKASAHQFHYGAAIVV